MDEIEWEEPPAIVRNGRGTGRNAAIAAQLRERPGRWAFVGSYPKRMTASAMAYQANQGRLKAYQPKGAFEAVARTVDGEFRVYARYVGDAS